MEKEFLKLTKDSTLECVHYGSDRFDKTLFFPIQNYSIKPKGGLWASLTSTKYGWKEWCKDENFQKENLNYFFVFIFSGKLLVIDKERDLDYLPWKKMPNIPIKIEIIDFESIEASGVDAILLTEKGQTETRLVLPRNLYGWDCESVLVLNSS